jgi:DNA polymerase-3 subunit epsilon
MDRKLKTSRPLAVLDLETTGVVPAQDRILEIAIVKVESDGRRALHHKRINPGIPIPPEATRVHGIRDQDVAECPSFEEVAPEIASILSGCDLIGYNLIKFDIPFLESEFVRAKIPFSLDRHRVIDACRIFQRKEPRDLTSALRFYCQEKFSNAHSAVADAEACWKVINAQLDTYDDLPLEIDTLHEFCNPRDYRFVDRDRKFEWRHNQATVAFGRNRGRSLKESAKEDPSFLEWILKSDFKPETKEIAKDALGGRFPERTAALPELEAIEDGVSYAAATSGTAIRN